MGLIVGQNVALAFLLTIIAGFASVLGGMIVFSHRLLSLANPHTLAAILSISSGVMVFISLVEIFPSTVELFKQALEENYAKNHKKIDNTSLVGHAWLLTLMAFVVGIIMIYVIDALIQRVSSVAQEEYTCSKAGAFIETAMRESLERFTFGNDRMSDAAVIDILSPDAIMGNSYIECKEKTLSESTIPSTAVLNSDMELNRQMDPSVKVDRRLFRHTGLLSAIAIGLHNFPEGMATFAGAIQDPQVGLALAFGIAIHNIPEGIAIAGPIYFASGSRSRGLLWCFIAALAEPLGALMAWLVLGNRSSFMARAILMGIVSGIMVGISIKEVLPNSFAYAGEKPQYVALGVFGGMIVMSFSFVLFAFAGVA